MTVVAAVDQSERAVSVLDQAKRLAADAGVDLHVVHVGEIGIPRPERGYDLDTDRQIAKQQASQIARSIANDVEGLETFESVGLVGDPAEELLEYSDTHDVDYIVVSARKRSPVDQAIFGSVTQTLLLNADRPIVATPHVSE